MTQDFHAFRSSAPFPSEADHIAFLLTQIDWSTERAARIQSRTASMIAAIRSAGTGLSEIETFLQHYPLSSPEGRSLMTLAEALLRVPDAMTADLLIEEKLAASDWKDVGGSGFFAAASRLGLGLAKSMLGGFLSGVSKPVIRKATTETVRRLGAQFVVGEDIVLALGVARQESQNGYRMSFDILGEGARTSEDAERYTKGYVEAAYAIGDANDPALPLEERHGMSVKLSALHPRYQWTQAASCAPVIVTRLLELARIAAKKGITLTVDAEESERLELSLEIFRRVALSPELAGWDGLGLAVQAYDRRAGDVIDYICALAQAAGRKIQVRLVKGAYWDGEIKRAQTAGWDQYPVFTRKSHTDLSYLFCAQKMLASRDVIRPMFATHNAATAAAILDMAGDDRSGFEFQRLFGMGQHLGQLLRHQENCPVTYYAPVGTYEDLLPYLVRRMLENGANTSFVSQVRDEKIPLEKLARDPVALVKEAQQKPLPIVNPPDLYGTDRPNAAGPDLSRASVREKFLEARNITLSTGTPPSSIPIDDYFQRAKFALSLWEKTPAAERAATLRKLADLLEQNTGHLMALLQGEAKKTLFDAVAEIREAVDFCRYYAAEGEKFFADRGQVMMGPTGERNTLHLRARGVFVAVSPWNFPLAIYLGQVTAALMAGNSVLAKPAEQTPRIAFYVAELLQQAGLPAHVLQNVAGDGVIGAALVAHPDVAGVVFTGSTEVARHIQRSLAAKNGPIVPLIAETGGQNAMIVDSTALPEQVVDDVLLSAFGSAGQRCSALRVLYLQEEIADKVIHLLQGAMMHLKIGAPDLPSTDVPPVIDREALAKLQAHRTYLDGFARLVAEAECPPSIAQTDCFFAPCAYEIDHIGQLPGEVFGPVLHLIRFAAKDLDQVIADINSTGYGLTFGLHSRLASRHQMVASSIRAGNIYINRNMIGAVVGVQPFGGQGLSGTGPKAGGPHYLHRFATEITLTDNIMATGGNVDLLAKAEI